MDVVALLREEWSTLAMILGGVLGAYAAADAGEWHWVAISLALVVAALRILQSEGWIMEDGISDAS